MDGFNKPLGVLANNQSIQTVTTIQTTVPVWAPSQYTVLYIYPACQFVNLTGVPVGFPPNISLYSHRIAPCPSTPQLRSFPTSQGSAAPRPAPKPDDRKPLQDEHYYHMRRSHNDSLGNLSEMDWHYVAHILKPEMEMCGFKLSNELEALNKLKQLCATQDIVTFEALETAVLERHSEDTQVKPLAADSLLPAAGMRKAGEISKGGSTSRFSALNLPEGFLSKIKDIEQKKLKSHERRSIKGPNHPEDDTLKLAAQPPAQAVVNDHADTASVIHTPGEDRLDDEPIYAEIPSQSGRGGSKSNWAKSFFSRKIRDPFMGFFSRSKGVMPENKPANSRGALLSLEKQDFVGGDESVRIKPAFDLKTDSNPIYSEPPAGVEDDYMVPSQGQANESDDRK